ncbi:hypothetical protein GGI12_005853, partial [Dipsacomyces acuminosporus]
DAYSINLSNNMLPQLPPNFGRTFGTLNILDISGNQITSLPEEISHLHSLRELYASRNALVSLPITMGSLRNLEVLELSENYLMSLDISISRLEKLRMLNISDNRLTSLPSYLGLLAQNLRILLVDGNPFEKFQRDLIEPILTVSSKEAKKIAKAKEKTEKLRAKAEKAGVHQSANPHSTTPLHSNEYTAALKRLISVRLKRDRRSTPVPLHGDANNRVSASSFGPDLKRAQSQSQAGSCLNDASSYTASMGRSISFSKRQQQHLSFSDAASIGSRKSAPVPPQPSFARAELRDSTVIPTSIAIANQMAALNIGGNGSMPSSPATIPPGGQSKPSE